MELEKIQELIRIKDAQLYNAQMKMVEISRNAYDEAYYKKLKARRKELEEAEKQLNEEVKPAL